MTDPTSPAPAEPPPVDRWERLNRIFHEAVGLPEGRRASYLAESCGDDPGLRDEIERLVAAHQRAAGFIASPAAADPEAWPAQEAVPPGRRLGAYRVVRQIARGGMGAVYLAERADGQYEQQVAIKVIKRGMDTEHLLARFRAERQILASLDHPHIARLLDGGTTDDGVPFFAMEYIAGEPIDAWADARQLPVEERIRLFLQVCGAVTYAHQHLVIHRDIKPLNILVTPEGVPKLLDFGIARVLHPGAEEATSTVTGLRLLTPEYASPEQVDGGHATTVSDVYSLGVVLYELLTGRSPYRPRSRAPLDVAEAVRSTDPDRPSVAVARGGSTERIRRRLRGDLDTILLTALRKEPARRYQSVEQFAADLQRHLDGLPVLARPDTFAYRAGKFVRRNRVPVAAGVLVAVALVGGTVATAWQARQARAAQARAERRFNDVRKLASTVLFDYHDAIKDLPGATPVRERLVNDALGYLDTLAREAQGDASLQRELAAAYRRVGDLQGGSYSSNLGDTKGALRSYQKSLSILEVLTRVDPGDGAARRDLAAVSLALADLVFDEGDVAGSIAYARRAEALLAPMAAAAPADSALRLELNAVVDKLGVLRLESGDPAVAAELHRGNIGRLEGAPAAERRSPRLRRSLSVGYQHLADAQAQLGDLNGALASYQRARAIRAELAAGAPENADYQSLVRNTDYWIAEVLAELRRYPEALERYRANLRADSAAARVDPKNVIHRSAIAFGQVRVGDMLGKLGRIPEALASYRQSLAIRAGEWAADSANLFKRAQLLESYARICGTLAGTAPAPADTACARLVGLLDATVVDPANAGYRGYFAGMYSDVGEAYDTLAPRTADPAARRRHRVAALELYRRSLAMWSDLASRGLINPADTGRVALASAAVARAEAALR